MPSASDNRGPFFGKHGPLLIAEIGGNHEGDFEYAERLVSLANASEADCVKLQLYRGDTLVNPIESPERNQHFKRFELSITQYRTLAGRIRAAGKRFVASVWDLELLDQISDLVDILKIGSGDLTAYPFLVACAKTGLPIILSTGLAHEEEVLRAVEVVLGVSPLYGLEGRLALLQCTSMYPIAMSDANLRVMRRLKDLTQLPTGYSDHTQGIDALKYASVLDADILEFHFTDDRVGKTFRDHAISLTPSEVQNLVEALDTIKLLKGSELKQPLAIEIENNHNVSFRRSIYAAADLPVGHQLTENDIAVLRPRHGLCASNYFKILGRKLRNPVARHAPLLPDDIEPTAQSDE
jgi:N-acetylneuraminate synthase/N,N'-diacetyllegionaminate synthase